jgi:DNA-binding response OmpR family regulator
MAIRLLFVDDEETIRATLPVILKSEGFDVTVGATVGEGLELMQREKFDVLLSDLNIGNPADGLVLVSAMRRLQPAAATFILTGYPDFETALEALRNQVDDYFTKPTNPRTLVSNIKSRLLNPRHAAESPRKSVAELLQEQSREVVVLWLEKVMADPKLQSIRLSGEERIDNLPLMIGTLTRSLRTADGELTEDARRQAAHYGSTRAKQGYSAGLLAKEARLLTKVVAELLERHLLDIDISTLVPGVLHIGQHLNAVLEEALDAFVSTQEPRHKKRVHTPGLSMPGE